MNHVRLSKVWVAIDIVATLLQRTLTEVYVYTMMRRHQTHIFARTTLTT